MIRNNKFARLGCIKNVFNAQSVISQKNTKSSQKALLYERGFSLAELSAALAFIAFIMIFLFTVMISILNTYNKGIWLSQINQAGRQISADLSDQARFSANRVVLADNRLCVDGVSYIWNKGNDDRNKFTDGKKIGLVRVDDQTGEYCAAKKDANITRDHSVTNLLSSGAMVQEFDVKYNSNTQLYKVSAVFSTAGNNKPTKKNGVWTCVDSLGFNQYCAFMNLDITVFRRGEK